MTRDPLDIDGNAAEAAQRLAQRQKAFDARVERLSVQMQTPAGRAFVWQVLEDAGVFGGLPTAPVGGSSMTEMLLLTEGQRGVGRVWLHLLHATPDLFALYPLMVQENHFAHGRDDRHPSAG